MLGGYYEGPIRRGVCPVVLNITLSPDRVEPFEGVVHAKLIERA
jgi:hypothetical protein